MSKLRGWSGKGEWFFCVVIASVLFLFASLALAGKGMSPNLQKATSGIQQAGKAMTTGSVAEQVPDVSPQDKININKADKETLLKIKGLGPTKAQNIIDYREKFGPFKKYEDLLKVKGIGEKTLELIKPFIKL